MMDTSKLRPDTRKAWAHLEGHPLLHGFVLVGGTALTMRIGHRVSEDLDFAYLGPRLPRARLDMLKRVMGEQGLALTPNPDAFAEQDFLDAGLDLADYQRDFLANDTVKVSFVRFAPPANEMLKGQESEPLRVATLDEIFATKCLACADRSKQRDWFDLFILLTGHGYTFDDVHRIFIQAKRPGNFGIAADRLRLCRPGLADEGYEALLPDAPSLDELRAFFNRELDRFEVRLAAAAFKAQHAATNVRKKPKRD